MSRDTRHDYDALVGCDDGGRLATGWQHVVRATCDLNLGAALTCGTWEPVRGTYGSAFLALARIPDGMRGVAAAARYGVDMSGCAFGRDLCDLNLSGMVAHGGDFGFCDLYGTLLTGARLQYAGFDDACAVGTDFRAADLYGASFRGAEAVNADFRAADLRQAKYRGANLAGCRFDAADLRCTNFVDADLEDATFHGALRFEVEGGDAPIDGWTVVGGRMVADR